jgi:hypothetical protein
MSRSLAWTNAGRASPTRPCAVGREKRVILHLPLLLLLKEALYEKKVESSGGVSLADTELIVGTTSNIPRAHAAGRGYIVPN